MASGKVLSLGQCAADHYSISRLLREQLGAEVVAVDTPREALDELRRQPFALVLVNRALNFGGSGLEFIGRLKADPALGRVPVMLVSNFEDAQRQAEARGALPGFGKSALNSPTTRERLASVLGGEASPAG
jgi:two-component system chemotaxis response regulator CheY